MSAVLRSTNAPKRSFGTGPNQFSGPRGGKQGAASVALWLFIMVASALFALFITAYTMRMSQADWFSIALPWQLWLSTVLLMAGSSLLQWSNAAARNADWRNAHRLFLAGGVCALVFLVSQLWGWQNLLAAHVMPSGNPAASFFYLLTAMHGLHVTGGVLAWGLTGRRIAHTNPDNAGFAWRAALCARYWHFLLAVWVVLFAVLGCLTPDMARFICGVK